MGATASKVPVAVLGAGLTGMSAAHFLRAAGIDRRLFEKLDRPGGHAVTIEEQGWRFDRTGHLLHVKDPELRALALAWMGRDHREIARDSRVWSHGVYTRYPFQANAHGLPPDVAHACVMGFLRARQQPQPERYADFEHFCRAQFGDAISDHFMIPYNTRVWGVPPSEITADWASRFVPIPEVEDVIAGAVGHRRRELGYNARFLYPGLGIGQLSDGMARALGDVELGRAPRSIDARSRRLVFDDERVDYDVLISTAPVPSLVRLIDDVPSEVKAAADRLRCTHLYYLDIALRGECGRPFHWIYVPEDRYPFYRVGCYSSFSPRMAPVRSAGLYVELVDRREPDLNELLPEVAAALIEMGLIARPEAIVFARVRRIDHAYVIFDHDHYPALEAVQEFLTSHRILSAGRYGGWNYSSMGDALAFGRQAAERAAGMLG
ncbi:MAG: NAD(P)-binding protein [Polyangiaceae bacterium]